MFTDVHPYEWVFLGASGAAALSSVSLFVVKIGDVLKVRHSGQNGATAYNTTEKARRQGFLFALTAIFFYASMTSINNQFPLNTQSLNLLSVLILGCAILLVDSWFTYRKRRRLPELIAQEERRIQAMTILGGRRSTDPRG
jgi:hypothetical protein